MMGTTPPVDTEMPSGSAWYGRGYTGGCDVFRCHFFRSKGVVHQHGTIGRGPHSGEAINLVLLAQTTDAGGGSGSQ